MTSKSKSRWVQKAIKHPGALKRYMARVYGKKAFTSRGTIKREYLLKALKRAEREHNTTLIRRINLALTLRKLRKK